MKDYEDKAQHPNRRVSREPEQPTEVGRPHLTWESGKQFPIKDTGWMNRNSKYIEDIQFQPGGGVSGELRVSGHHPKRGAFSHNVPFEDRDVMREDLKRSKWSHISMDDQMRDGGGPQHRRETDAFHYGSGESGDCGCSH
jgi:hypothetical protein